MTNHEGDSRINSGSNEIMKALLQKRLETSWGNAKRIHSYWLKRSEGRWRLLIALLIWWLFSWQLLSTDPKLGISFLFTVFMAIYSGVIYRSREAIAFVVGGVLLGITVLPTFLGAWEAAKNGDWIAAAITVLLGLFLLYWSSTMKAGELPEFNDGRKSHQGRRTKH
ncbi:MAG: hypothetical protein KAX20_06340 [Candidatus Omnitrophica bacterium]|nr:hypothetical protein [Candidatus Omnitrophota bacterium]